jgi:hypothetical protein
MKFADRVFERDFCAKSGGRFLGAEAPKQINVFPVACLYTVSDVMSTDFLRRSLPRD